jgi:hypothetical protein
VFGALGRPPTIARSISPAGGAHLSDRVHRGLCRFPALPMPSATVNTGTRTHSNPGNAKPNTDRHRPSDAYADGGTTGERPSSSSAQCQRNA